MTAGARRIWTVIQALLLLATVVWVTRALERQWHDVRAVAATTQIRWNWILIASVMVLLTYGMLIQSWRLLLSGWGGRLRYGAAVRIWTIANLGRYLPGKVWSVSALGVLAQREGVSGVTAAGAAILGTLLNIGTGFGILALSGAPTLGAFSPTLRLASVSASVAFVLVTALLPVLLPPVLQKIVSWRQLPPLETHLPGRALWIATGMNALSWLGYGMAFAAFTRGVAPQVHGSPILFVTVWTASYLMGYVVLFAPGGIGVRDVAMGGGLVALALAGNADATWIALTSRVWMTVLEVLPGLLALLWVPLSTRALHRAD